MKRSILGLAVAAVLALSLWSLSAAFVRVRNAPLSAWLLDLEAGRVVPGSALPDALDRRAWAGGDWRGPDNRRYTLRRLSTQQRTIHVHLRDGLIFGVATYDHGPGGTEQVWFMDAEAIATHYRSVGQPW